MKTYSNEQVEDVEKYLFEIENNYLNPSGKFKKIREILSAPVSSVKNKKSINRIGMEKPKRSDDKYWIGTNNFDHIQFENDLEEYILLI